MPCRGRRSIMTCGLRWPASPRRPGTGFRSLTIRPCCREEGRHIRWRRNDGRCPESSREPLAHGDFGRQGAASGRCASGSPFVGRVGRSGSSRPLARGHGTIAGLHGDGMIAPGLSIPGTAGKPARWYAVKTLQRFGNNYDHANHPVHFVP